MCKCPNGCWVRARFVSKEVWWGLLWHILPVCDTALYERQYASVLGLARCDSRDDGCTCQSWGNLTPLFTLKHNNLTSLAFTHITSMQWRTLRMLVQAKTIECHFLPLCVIESCVDGACFHTYHQYVITHFSKLHSKLLIVQLSSIGLPRCRLLSRSTQVCV